MAYADFDYYTDTYLGSAIAEADFPRLAARASVVIDQLTYNRAAAVITADEDADMIDKVQMATCAVAEEWQLIEQDAANGAGVVQSERVGQHSVTYALSHDAARSAGDRCIAAASLYLDQTRLMYAGFNEDER